MYETRFDDTWTTIDGSIRCTSRVYNDVGDYISILFSARRVKSQKTLDDVEFGLNLPKNVSPEREKYLYDLTREFFTGVVPFVVEGPVFRSRNPHHHSMFYPFSFSRPQEPYVMTDEDMLDYARTEQGNWLGRR